MAIQINGVVQRVFFKELTTPDRYNAENKFRRSVKLENVKGIDTSTFSPVELPNELWVSAGNCKAERFCIKHGAGFHDVAEGDTISLEVSVTHSGDNTYYNGKGVKLVAAAPATGAAPAGAPTGANASTSTRSAPAQGTPANQQKASSQKKPYGAKDMTGISTGHAMNGAFRFLKEKGNDLLAVVQVACDIHVITESLKAEVRKRYPEMSEYDSGAMTGHAILNACDQAKSIKDIEGIANDILNVVPLVQGFIKTGERPDTGKDGDDETSQNGLPWDDSSPAFPSEAVDMDDVPFK